MSHAVTAAGEWRISTRARGEVLTAGARAPGCQFVVLAVPGGNTIPEIEGWLRDLLGVASESSRNDLNPRPIPALLHHALTGLLFSHREVWSAVSNRSPFSLAFVRAGDEVAFGWVGEMKPQVWVDDQPAEARWVRVRDHEGREARAFAAPLASKVRVSLEWTPGAAIPGAAAVDVEAEWAGVGRAEPAAGAGEGSSGGSAAAAGEKRLAAYGAWRDRVRAAEEAQERAPASAGPGAEPPAGGSDPGNAGAEPHGGATDRRRRRRRGRGSKAHRIAGAPGEPGAEPATAAARPDAPSAARKTEDPDLVPPTPEPADLTARAIGQGADPRAAAIPRPPAVAAEETWPPRPASRRPRVHSAWPTESEIESARRPGVRPWVWLLGVTVAVIGAWIAGWIPGVKPGKEGLDLPIAGFGAARFQVRVSSQPDGASIAADGKDQQRRTPATIELPAGEHQIELSFPDLGSATYKVNGKRGERKGIDAALWGSLAVRSPDAGVPITVELDGARVGYAPITIDSLAPGPHEVRFSGPGLSAWGQALRVRVADVTEVIARPMTSPASGVLEVRATFTDENGTNELPGATVWVDGAVRGVTPLVLELPRGPHSARVAYRGENAAVQVIDLPGGNQRFATFELGVDRDLPTLTPTATPGLINLGRPTVISASLDGVTTADVREMWLNVRETDGSWRRYQMVMLKAPAGVVGVAVFPTALFDGRGTTRYYMSASTQTGDEYFTEILTARSASAPVQNP
ncbi:MAG TPA: PEGA domain-containing protein [Candidatus Eisenbacteria bacterium]|jgi:hypothetical protein